MSTRGAIKIREKGEELRLFYGHDAMPDSLGHQLRRDTKWKRKAKAYERCFVYRLPDAEIVMTREQMGVLEATIKGGSLQRNPDAVVRVSGKDIGKAMAAYVRRKQPKGI